MSQRVMFSVVYAPSPGNPPRTLHFVPAGSDRCAVCGLTKLRMGFHYTDQAEMWDVIKDEPILGMWSPSDEGIKPYTPCRLELDLPHGAVDGTPTVQ